MMGVNQPYYPLFQKMEAIENKKDDKPKIMHWDRMKIQPIDMYEANYSKDEFRGFLKGNVSKYIMRYQSKNGIDDLEKAKIYLDWLIKFEKGLSIRVPDR